MNQLFEICCTEPARLARVTQGLPTRDIPTTEQAGLIIGLIHERAPELELRVRPQEAIAR